MGIRLLFLSGIIYLIYMLPQNFFRLDYFNINKVNVTDNSKMLHDELTKLTEKLYNKNSIYIGRNEIKEFIEKDIRVESATVEKKSLGEIDIDVKEKDLAYYAVIGKNIYLTDKEGRIFAYLNEKEVEGVPFIIANNEEEIKEKGIQGVKKIIFGRTLFVIFAFLIQFALLAVTYIWLRDYSYVFYLLFVILSVSVVLHLFKSNESPDFKLPDGAFCSVYGGI